MTTLLLVEDEDEARASLARAFGREGFDCREASTTESALALAKDEQVDLAILDLKLGDDDRGGLTVLSALRARPAPPPAILVTAFADVEKVKEALNLGASYLLEKPFRAADLVAVARRLLAEQRDLSGLVTAALSRASLTERETQIARLVLKGLPSAEIAVVLGSSDKTVRQHITRIYEKCGVSSRPELFHYVFPF